MQDFKLRNLKTVSEEAAAWMTCDKEEDER